MVTPLSSETYKLKGHLGKGQKIILILKVGIKDIPVETNTPYNKGQVYSSKFFKLDQYLPTKISKSSGRQAFLFDKE